MIKDVQEKILQLKKENDICILAHSYQAKEIVEIADITGDSYKLSVEAQKVSNKNILMCGVHFMAEATSALQKHYILFRTGFFYECTKIAVRNEQYLVSVIFFTIFTADEEVTQTSQTLLSAAVVFM